MARFAALRNYVHATGRTVHLQPQEYARIDVDAGVDILK